jgi:hypothetical protein
VQIALAQPLLFTVKMPRLPITLESPPERDTAPDAFVALAVLPAALSGQDGGQPRLLKGPWYPAFDDAIPYEPVI